MQKANQILQAVRKLGEKRIPLRRVYRNLYSEDLFLTAYGRLYRNEGALTPGSTNDTVDGMSLKRIQTIIEQLRHERFQFRPSRRVSIPKKSGGKRHLGIPNFTEKLVQEVLRMLLEAYYEPRFRDSSHGFRYQRGCHTAIKNIKQKFISTAWFIEGDIRGCFDNIEHDVLLTILSKDIHDGRLLNLIRLGLEAGVLEDWRYETTHSGAPQGGVLSPLLSNIYLHELDVFIEDTLIPQYTCGKTRAHNKEYKRLTNRILRGKKRGKDVSEIIKQRRQLPSGDTHDPNFRRLRYIRYADDFLLGFMGPKAEAEAIKEAIGAYLQSTLKLSMNTEKTLITHARTQYAKFLGYAVSVYHANDKISLDRNIKRRSINGQIRLGIPYGLVDEHIQRYQRKGKIVGDNTLIAHSDAHIIDAFQSRFRGLSEYYKYAVDRNHLNKLQHEMEISLIKTLAGKFRTSASDIYRKYRGRQTVQEHSYRTLQVEVPTKSGSRLIYWGAIPLRVVPIGRGTLNDVIGYDRKYARADLIQRLQANQCDLCGSTQDVEVHHVRKLANLQKRWAGRRKKPDWVIRMIGLRRKTLIVCRKCHNDIHAGRPTPKIRK
jgi:group II intron reverse transcriptase/maturase